MRLKKIYASLVLAGFALFILALGVRWIVRLTLPAADTAIQASAVLPLPTLSATSTPILPTTTPLPTFDPSQPLPTVDSSQDEWEQLPDSIRKLLVLVQEQTVGEITVRVSNVLLKDTHAFVRICMDQPGTAGAFNVGGSTIGSAGAVWGDAFVHDSDSNPAEYGRCVIMEYLGIPLVQLDSFHLMVGSVYPDSAVENQTITFNYEGPWEFDLQSARYVP